MAKRFTATEIWSEDWFLIMPVEYKLFWYYMLANCNHAGFFRVNLRSFCGLNGVNLTSTSILDFFNDGKLRIRVVNQSLWLIEDFFVYQYGSTLNKNNRVHDSITKEYLKHNIDLTSIRGLKDLKERVKDKDKDKDNVLNGHSFSVPVIQKQEPVGSDVVQKCANKAWSDQRWKENTCMANSIKEDKLKKWMSMYNASICNDSFPDFDESKYKKLFGGWLQRQISKGYNVNEISVTTPIDNLKKM